MSNKYPTANITLSSIEDKGLTLKIKDSEGKSWVLWKNDYQTKAPSEAFESLTNYKIGDTFGITYGEKQEEYQGKQYTKRTIYSILPTVANPTPATPKNPLYNAPVASEPIKNDKFWDMKAYKQCLWNYWLEMTAAGIELKLDWKDDVWNVFKDIEADGKKRFFEFDKQPPVDNNHIAPGSERFSEPLPEELPSMDIHADLNEDIPY